MDIYEIIRRWHDQQSTTQIALALNNDRKTIRKYIALAKLQGLSLDQPLPAKEVVIDLLPQAIAQNIRPATAQQILEPFLPEITTLVNDKYNSLKPKIAFEVICQKYDLAEKISYSSFKNFVRHHQLALHPDKATCRIEVAPGSLIQIDYAKVGYLFDPYTNKNRTVYAFIATLGYSRHKFVEFTFKQDQPRFIASHVNMFDFFGGVAKHIKLDNLKTGVLKPDLYDPKLNHTYQELAEHYHCFIDVCRVRHPKDKGKVERDVQTIRQAFRKFGALFPTMDLSRANRLIKQWSTEEYGQKPHGTTHLKPYPTFIETEQPLLKPLPQEHFEIAQWKQAKVHPDQYIQFNKKSYSVPQRYVGKTVWVKGTHKIIQIYYQHQLIKQHPVATSFRQTDLKDFPANVQAALDDGLPLILQNKAAAVGDNFAHLIRTLLKQHAFLNLRKAQGLVSLALKFDAQLIEQAATVFVNQQLTINYKLFKQMVEKITSSTPPTTTPLSQQSLQFVRDMDYFIHDNLK
ncbi:MAG: IS21 family transposase [Pseudomonadota bacterium]